ncbi:MAG: hypothetical protein ACRYFX_14910 [Janthinobacterium lividum]
MLTHIFCTVRGLFRRWFPLLIALALITTYYRYTDYQEAHRATLATAVKAGQLNADSPLVADAHNLAVPPFGLVAGKLFFAFVLFFGGLAVVWFVLGYVLPVVPRWAKANYKAAFLGFHPHEQVRTFNLVWLSLLGYFALCVLAACLVS